MKRLTCALFGALAMLAFCAPAEARGHLHHHHRHSHHHHLARSQHAQPEGAGGWGWSVPSLGGGSLVQQARSYVGETAGQLGLPGSLWCADFMNKVLRDTGHRGTGSREARSFLKLPHTAPHVGAIAVLARGRGQGHVGVVTAFDANGNPVILSGNHNRRVGEGTYPRGRVLAYVDP